MYLEVLISKWLKVSFLNLSLVALLGVVMRYKIAYSLPFIDQKHVQHAHSHFAFAGWLGQVLMTLLAIYMARRKGDEILKKYNWLLLANTLTAYGMLVAFCIQGYGIASITFSALSILVSFVFVFIYWKDLNSLPVKSIAHHWFKAALLFNVISSAGTIALSIMMATQTAHEKWYLLAEYFFLHFQYNGWFIFTCLGLLYDKLKADETFMNHGRLVFWLFASAFLPCYFLSALWLPIPLWLFAIVVLAAFLQVTGWSILAIFMIRNIKKLVTGINKLGVWILSLSAMAFSIKLLLQLGSTIPSLSQVAFGFRPIVIGYLHLVLLGVITLFIIGYILSEALVAANKKVTWGVILFTSGIILNELLLMIQGANAMAYVSVPHINEMLLFAAIIMLSGVILLNIGLYKNDIQVVNPG